MSRSPPGDPRAEAQNALKQAANAARRNDIKAAERWSKVAAQLIEHAEKLAKLPPPACDPQEEEAIRAEIRARLRRLVEASEQDAPDAELEAIVRQPFSFGEP